MKNNKKNEVVLQAIAHVYIPVGEMFENLKQYHRQNEVVRFQEFYSTIENDVVKLRCFKPEQKEFIKAFAEEYNYTYTISKDII